jgi:hypothetical protein
MSFLLQRRRCPESLEINRTNQKASEAFSGQEVSGVNTLRKKAGKQFQAVKDITDAVMYLTDAATFTGAILYVDGGAHFARW